MHLFLYRISCVYYFELIRLPFGGSSCCNGSQEVEAGSKVTSGAPGSKPVRSGFDVLRSASSSSGVVASRNDMCPKTSHLQTNIRRISTQLGNVQLQIETYMLQTSYICFWRFLNKILALLGM